mgnify:FL=1
MKTLSIRQQEVLNALVDFQSKHGYPPTYAELARLVGFSSANGAFEHIRALEKKGYITTSGGTARGIKVIGANDALDEATQVISALLTRKENATALAHAWLKRRGSAA